MVATSLYVSVPSSVTATAPELPFTVIVPAVPITSVDLATEPSAFVIALSECNFAELATLITSAWYEPETALEVVVTDKLAEFDDVAL